MSDVIAIIPARSGSKSVSDKNIKLLSGHPLIAYSIAAANLSKSINRVMFLQILKITQVLQDLMVLKPLLFGLKSTRLTALKTEDGSFMLSIG